MQKTTKLSSLEQHVVDYIRKLRTERKLTQQAIGKIIGVQASFIGNVENKLNPSKYNLRHIQLLANHFNLAPSGFLPSSPDQEDEKLS